MWSCNNMLVIICWPNKFILGTQERPQWWHYTCSSAILLVPDASWFTRPQKEHNSVQSDGVRNPDIAFAIAASTWQPSDDSLSLQISLYFGDISICLCWGLSSCLYIAVWIALRVPHDWLHLYQIWPHHQPLFWILTTRQMPRPYSNYNALLWKTDCVMLRYLKRLHGVMKL